MKRWTGVVTASVIEAALLLGGCTETRDGPGSALPEETSSTAETSTMPTEAAFPSGNAVSEEQVASITKEVIDKTSEVEYCILLYPSLLEADETQTIPEDPDFWLVTDERFPNMAALKAYTETYFTASYVDKYFSEIFRGDGESGFKEYDGRLYANCRQGGRGNIREFDWDSLRILSQDEDCLTVEVDVHNDSNTRIAVQTYMMVKSGDKWLLNDEITTPVG